MGFKILMFLAAGALVCADGSQTDNSPHGDPLQGVWKLTAGEANGNVLSQAELKDGKLEIQGDHYTVTLAEIGKLEGTQKLGVVNDVLTIGATNEKNGEGEKPAWESTRSTGIRSA